MPTVVKIDPEWSPSENPSLEVGGEVFIGDASTLIAEGKVELAKNTRKPAKKAKK